MDQQRSERILTFIYFCSALLSIIELGSLSAAWIHWREILDTCPNYRCECILYGESGFNYFNGGKNMICHFANFASIPVILISIPFTIYHAYRTCIASRRTHINKATYRRGRNEENATVPARTRVVDNGCKCWGLIAGLCVLVAILLLANAVIVTDGYYKSCDQYRRTLVKSLVANGNNAKVIYDRLQCGAIFDFMDYMEPFTRPFVIKDESRHRPTDDTRDFNRGDMINTGIALQIAIVCLWFNFTLWVMATVCNFLLARANGGCCSCSKVNP